jgi:hypothetical protein
MRNVPLLATFSIGPQYYLALAIKVVMSLFARVNTAVAGFKGRRPNAAHLQSEIHLHEAVS